MNNNKIMNYKIKVNKGYQLIALSNTILREIASHITQLITNYEFLVVNVYF